MYELIAGLYPICRSITGDGVRETLRVLGRHLPLEMHEVPSGTRVFDWTVPNEWNIRDAYIKDSHGRRVVDFRASNLHVVSYSVPVWRKMSLAELKSHLFTIPEHPDWIPYRTSYYQEGWGFCISQNQLLALTEDEYEVCIDASLEPGHLTYGECYLPGSTENEVLLSSHICHPSLCNDNLSGVALVTFLAKHLQQAARRYSYRMLFIPGTIGAITWLSLNEARVGRIKHGLVVTGVGDAGTVTYKKSRRGDADVDRAAAHVLAHAGGSHRIVDFFPHGADERQFCSPGFNLPVGCFMRSPHGTYAECHTSADNLAFVRPEQLADSFDKALAILGVLDADATYLNRNPKCEPQLGRRGLYRAMGGGVEHEALETAVLWVLNLSDGSHSLLDIAIRSGLDFSLVRKAADLLLEVDLLEELPLQQPDRADAFGTAGG